MEYNPPLKDVLEYKGPERYVAVSLSLLADMETPISIFQRLSANRSDIFLLESVIDGAIPGRYSFMSVKAENRFEFADGEGIFIGSREKGAKKRVKRGKNPLEILRQELSKHTVWAPQELPRFIGGAVGYIGFDSIQYLEKLPLPSQKGIPIPETVMLLCKEIYIYDHLLRRLILIQHAGLERERGKREQSWNSATKRLKRMLEQLQKKSPDTMPIAIGRQESSLKLAIENNRSREEMYKTIERARQAIIAGEIFQVVVSMRLTIKERIDPFLLYRALRLLNPSPYMFYFNFGAFAVVGASPEVLVRLEEGELLLRPIAGTRPRGKDVVEDEALEKEMLEDQKELAEHRMLVDLGRNDLGRVAATGSIEVRRPMHVERYSHVMHIVTDLQAKLADGLDAFDVFQACFPAGTVSGAPKIRACELLAELEPDRRGLYAGAVGYFGFDGNMDTCIALRTMIVEKQKVHIQVGAGLVYDSQPNREYKECMDKAGAGLKALEMALSQMKTGK